MAEVRKAGTAVASKKKAARKKTTSAKKTAKKVAKKKRTTTRKSAASKGRRTSLTPEARYRLIAEIAFLKAEKRGFEGGDPVRDWLEAEKEVDG